MPPSFDSSASSWASSSYLVSQQAPLPRLFGVSPCLHGSVWRRPLERRRGLRWIVDKPNPVG